MTYEVVNPKQIQTEIETFWVGLYRQAYTSDRWCAMRKKDGEPAIISDTTEQRVDFIERAKRYFVKNPAPVTQNTICPDCDKKVVALRNYDNGAQLFIHEQEVITAPFPHVDIIESCYIPAPDKLDPMEAEGFKREQDICKTRMRKAHGH